MRQPHPLLLSILAAALLAACGSAAGAPSGSTQAAGSAASAGTAASAPGVGGAQTSTVASAAGQLTYVVPRLFGGQATFDPSKTTSLFIAASLGAPIFEELFTFVPPDGQVKPFLLQSSTMAPDGMSWTFKLRSGITFSNGDPMTADDVKFSLDRFLSPDSASASHAVLTSAVAGVEVVDPLTVKITLKRPMINLPYTLTYPGNEGVVLPSKYIKQVGWEAFGNKPVGSGPYVLADYKPGQSVTYQQNPKYWGSSKPALRQIDVVQIPEEMTRISMLQSGKANLTPITAANKSSVESSGFKTLVVPETTAYMLYPFGAYGTYPDNPLKKLEVRKALTLALDKKALLDALNAGVGEVAAYGPSAPNPSRGAPNLPPTPYDPEQAKQLLQQAGFPNGFTFKLFATDVGACSTEVSNQFATAVAGYWQKIGVTAQITPMSYATLRPKILANPSPPDMVGTMTDFCLGGFDLPSDTLNTAYASKGLFHTTDVADKEIQQAGAAKSIEEQNKYVQAAYQKIYDNYSAICLFFAGSMFAADKTAQDYPATRGYPNMLARWVTPRPGGAAP